MNITDVGHLTDDGDAWQDKMEKWAKRDGTTVWEIAEKYINIFMQDIQFLDCNHFDEMPRATDYINEQIAMVKKLVAQWLTYEIAWDGIYCDTAKVPEYGKLLPDWHLEWLQEWARIEHSWKRNATDFALWKYSPRDQKRAMERIFDWDREGTLITDWIRSWLTEEEVETYWFPWRHIECSAMAYALLGSQIDIHTWGIEHIPVHHTNEIVQAECSFCKTPWVWYWFHLQHLQIDWTKISKSLGNVVYISDLKEKGFSTWDVRYFFLTAHYRNFQDFTWENLEAARNTRHNIVRKLLWYDLDALESTYTTNWELHKQVSVALANDLDTVWALHIIASSDLTEPQNARDLIALDRTVLRLWLIDKIKEIQEQEKNIPVAICRLAEERLEAKLSKEYNRADEIRDQLLSAWREVRDSSDWYTISKAL